MCKKGKIVAFFANAFLNVYYMMDLFFLNTHACRCVSGAAPNCRVCAWQRNRNFTLGGAGVSYASFGVPAVPGNFFFRHEHGSRYCLSRTGFGRHRRSI